MTWSKIALFVIVLFVVLFILHLAGLISIFNSALSLVLSIIAVFFTALSFFHRVSPSISARLETQVLPLLTQEQTDKLKALGIENPGFTVNYGGADPIAPGGKYLDLLITNGGPGSAFGLTWQLEILGYKEGTHAIAGYIPLLEPGGRIVVQGNLRVYHENKKSAMESYKKKNGVKGEPSHEQMKEVLDISNSIAKYKLHLKYKQFLSEKELCPITFNEDGGYIIPKTTE